MSDNIIPIDFAKRHAVKRGMYRRVRFRRWWRTWGDDIILLSVLLLSGVFIGLTASLFLHR